MSGGGRRGYYGKFRGTVIDNADPDQRGRLTLSVPDVLGSITSGWAEPVVPLSGPSGSPMGVFLVPPIGTGVWAEFEHGDPDYPIWSGCRWGSQADVPSSATQGDPADPNIVIQSLSRHSIVISDTAPSETTGGILIQSAGGAQIVVNDSGIYINNGKGGSITLIDDVVKVNDGALQVT
jgi:uncharacterized protein involved in type VI secretion and phage assembly